MLQTCNICLVIADPNWLMQGDNGVSRKDPSNARRCFSPSLKIKPFGVTCESGKNLSIQHGNTSVHLLRSSLVRVVSTLVVFLETEACFLQERALCDYLL